MSHILDVDFDSHGLGGFKLTALVDGAFSLGAAVFLHQNGAVGPGAGGQEALVGGGIDEHIIQHVMRHLHAAFRIVHVETGAQEYPTSIVGGEDQVPLGGVC